MRNSLVLECLYLVCSIVFDLDCYLDLFREAVLFVIYELDVLLIDFKVAEAWIIVLRACASLFLLAYCCFLILGLA